MLYNKSEYIETVRGAVCGSGWRGWAGMGSGLDWTGLGSARLGDCLFSPQASGNKVSRQSVLCGSQNIVLNGKVSSGTRESCVYRSTALPLVCPRCCRRQCFCPCGSACASPSFVCLLCAPHCHSGSTVCVSWHVVSLTRVYTVTENTSRCFSSFISLPFLVQTIVMNDCIIRGDLANVRVGRHCVVKSRSVIRPPFKKFSKG